MEKRVDLSMEMAPPIDRDDEILIFTRLAAKMVKWDEESVRLFHERRLAEAERRRMTKKPAVRGGHPAESLVVA
jgi:hypothetical protein